MNRSLLVIAVVLMGMAVPAVCAGETTSFSVDAYRTVLQVQTDDITLGRIAQTASGNSAYICRDARMIPATVGETLLHGDMISVQSGQSVRLRLVDRPDEVVLDGGAGGTNSAAYLSVE